MRLETSAVYSTAHITEEGARFLEKETNASIPELVVSSLPHGFRIWVGFEGSASRKIPSTVGLLVDLCKGFGVDWLILDRDETPDEGLPTYDW